ncbi:SCO family protein [Catenovulum sp. 2E275]|uniref:SCO family protein n=1 Tax=Catenovulum sp. 2E275 TaxID=2980497 RepID=UPI0021CF8544|nr:SCO family protein [Catenovulum sp. 2E275]MCU4674427.1 SCO family protein [Catenovulum sp. 2E275]
MKQFSFSRLIFITCLVFLSSCGDKAQNNFDNVQIFEPARILSPFELTNNQHTNLTLDSLKNHWSIIFLGYTYCPDICPTTLADLARVYPDLKQANQDLQVVFISADPQRDNIKQLDQYIRFFHPEFIAATAQHPKLLPFTRELGLIYSLAGEGDNYLVNHSASLVIVDPEGRLRARVKPDMKVQPAKIDYQQLVSVVQFLSK